MGLVVESTYNWYWLVDALMEAGYPVHLANTAAMVQYSGLKYSDDDPMHVGWRSYCAGAAGGGLYLPQGGPRGARSAAPAQPPGAAAYRQPAGDSVQNLFARDRGRSLSANEVKRLTPEGVSRLLPDPNQALAVQATLLAMRGHEAAIDLLEREAPWPRSGCARPIATCRASAVSGKCWG